jgi:hypothetical protein
MADNRNLQRAARAVQLLTAIRQQRPQLWLEIAAFACNEWPNPPLDLTDHSKTVEQIVAERILHAVPN